VANTISSARIFSTSEKRADIVGDTSSVDSDTLPLCTVIEHDRAGDRYFEWSPRKQVWEPSEVN
jgi:hypothetical protein